MSRLLGLLGATLLLSGGVAMVVADRRSRRRSGVQRLRTVLESAPAPGQDRSQLAAAWSELTRAVERVGGRTAAAAWLAARLERGNWPLRSGEFAIVVLGSALFGALVLAALLATATSALGGFVLGATAPLALLDRQVRRSAARADEQLPEVLGQLAASMRAGHSLLQAMEAVAERAPAPLGPEFTRVLAETRIGRSFDEAMTAMADRVGSTDLRWTVRAVLIQSRTGGRLADILEVLAEFMRDREEVRREVRALTADGRISAIVLIALPFVVAGALLVVSPSYLLPLVQEPIGIAMLIGAVVLMALSTLWIRRMVRIEV